MKNILFGVSLVLSPLMMASVGNAATLVDFTNSADWTSGQTSRDYGNGVNVTVTATGGALTVTNPYDGGTAAGSCAGPGKVLACNQDGLGIIDDEVTGVSGTANLNESLLLTFQTPVDIGNLYFLDVFKAPASTGVTALNGVSAGESVLFDVNGVFAGELFAQAAYASLGGYLSATVSLLNVSTIRFYAGLGKDDGSADFALAALSLTPVPVPAALPLFATGIAAVAYAGRRKRKGEAAQAAA
jgi:hypothetical protein